MGAKKQAVERVPQQPTPSISGRTFKKKYPKAWLWCLHCSRFFQAKDLKSDGFVVEGCAFFDECGGAGFDVDIFGWDAWAHYSKEWRWWPKTEAALTHGLESTLYPRAVVREFEG